MSLKSMSRCLEIIVATAVIVADNSLLWPATPRGAKWLGTRRQLLRAREVKLFCRHQHKSAASSFRRLRMPLKREQGSTCRPVLCTEAGAYYIKLHIASMKSENRPRAIAGVSKRASQREQSSRVGLRGERACWHGRPALYRRHGDMRPALAGLASRPPMLAMTIFAIEASIEMTNHPSPPKAAHKKHHFSILA